MSGDFRPLTPEERTELDNFTMKELEGNNVWRPIEEAPKDGTEVLGCYYSAISKVPYFDVIFYVASVGYFADASGNQVKATHFMPLPNPPKK